MYNLRKLLFTLVICCSSYVFSFSNANAQGFNCTCKVGQPDVVSGKSRIFNCYFVDVCEPSAECTKLRENITVPIQFGNLPPRVSIAHGKVTEDGVLITYQVCDE